MADSFFPKSTEDLLPAARAAELSGLEIIQGMADGSLPAAPIGSFANMTLVRVDDGMVEFQAVPAFKHYNPQGAVHGGWFGIVLDSAMGCAVMTRVPRGFTYTTLEYKVNMLRAVLEATGPLRVIGQSIHAGRRTATSEARIEGTDGKLYATANCTCMILPLQSA